MISPVKDVLRPVGEEHLTLKHYEKAVKFLDTFSDNKYFEALLTLRRAECYFNREQAGSGVYIPKGIS
ncbi:MAG: hypothetical protein ABR572_07935 [Cryomorphaceae bacterium]|nr:hypothetical protein [Flavobacteriales bacterium]